MQKILIIGLGLIGGSFAKSLKSHDPEAEIDVIENCQKTVDLAKKIGLIENSINFDGKFKRNYDLIAICCPLSAYKSVFQGLKSSLRVRDLPLIIDLGSLKEFTLDCVDKLFLPHFIACHIIAGSDKSGFENSDAELFSQKKLIICQNSRNSKKDVEKLVLLASKIKLKTEFLEFRKHDEIYGLVSHLPQFLSFLSREFEPKNLESKHLKRSFRLNNSNPKIWAEIFSLNDKNIEKFYVETFENLMEFAEKIDSDQFDDVCEEICKIAKEFDVNEGVPVKIDKDDLAKVLLRLLIVASYMKITKIKEFLSYSGTGFADFTAILGVFSRKNLTNQVKDCKIELLSMLDEI